MDSLSLVHAAETHVLFLQYDSSGQVGGPPFLRVLLSGSPAPVFDTPIIVSIVKDLCYFLTCDFQMGIHFLILGFCVLEDSHSKWCTKGPTRRNSTITQAYFPNCHQWDLNSRSAAWG